MAAAQPRAASRAVPQTRPQSAPPLTGETRRGRGLGAALARSGRLVSGGPATELIALSARLRVPCLWQRTGPACGRACVGARVFEPVHRDPSGLWLG